MEKEVGLEEGYQQAIELLEQCVTSYGFLASLQKKNNYKRIWGRDSMICGLAALMSGNLKLIKATKKSLLTLMKYQHKHGQIPSNVEVSSNKISYGMSTGRIDAALWFIITFSQYVKRTNDKAFLRKHYSSLKKAYEISHLYEFNDRGFIYVPKGGDWADEYIQEGYVLYDELLYYQAIKEYMDMRKILTKSNKKLDKKKRALRKSILVNYAIEPAHKQNEHVYHPVVFAKALKNKLHTRPYLLPYFNPSGYGHRFDGFANCLALLLGILPKDKEEEIHKYIKKNFNQKTNYLIPAFYPAISPKEHDWQELKNSFAYEFKNKPGQYHNGGLWPIITGFYAAASKDKNDVEMYLRGINHANFQPGNKPNFYEYTESNKLKPKGTKYQAWSAAAGIMAHQSYKGEKVLL